MVVGSLLLATGCSGDAKPTADQSQSSQELQQVRDTNRELKRLQAENQDLAKLRKDNAELQRLRSEAEKLPELRQENLNLRAQLQASKAPKGR